MTISEKKSHFGAWRLFLAVFTAVVLVIAICFAAVMKDVTGIDIDDNKTVDIPEGAGASVVADLLSENDVIKYPSVFKLCSRLGGFDSQYQPGTVTLHNNMSYNDVLRLITSDRNTVKVVIPEGYTSKQIAKALSDAGVCSEKDFFAALDPSLYDYKFLKDLPERENQLEGYLFPATYEFIPNTDAKEVVRTMLDSFNNVFTDEYYARTKAVNMTVDEVVTMASIVERETNAQGERAKVAGVFYNRINSGMKLESCATVQYILGENKPVLSVADTQIDSPYNTYQHTGLPIGPIANPGAECIKAALYPEKTDAFYFLLGSNGNHIFSKTYEEHKKAMEENGL